MSTFCRMLKLKALRDKLPQQSEGFIISSQILCNTNNNDQTLHGTTFSHENQEQRLGGEVSPLQAPTSSKQVCLFLFILIFPESALF